MGGAPSATFVRKTGNEGVADYVATTSGGYGYVETFFAQPFATYAPITPNTPAPIQAALQSPVPGATNFLTATLTISLVADSTYPCVLRVDGLPIVANVTNAYPIITQTYALTYSRYASPFELDAVKNLFSFILGKRPGGGLPIQANDQIAQGAGFIILGKGTTASTINSLRDPARACINSAVSG
jgi:ABC-type phosphate transport system substrate-binding protein